MYSDAHNGLVNGPRPADLLKSGREGEDAIEWEGTVPVKSDLCSMF